MIPNRQTPSEFMQYLVDHCRTSPLDAQLPSLKEISENLGISTSRLREQLEEAKALGLVEVKPRTGIRCLPYAFDPVVWRSLSYVIALDPKVFYSFADLRKRVELAYWHQATEALTEEDLEDLRQLVDQAQAKLNGTPVQIPHNEHRQLHMTIFRRLDNVFVQGILVAYWDAYESIGLSMVTGLDYLREVWEYHDEMVEAICNGDLESGFRVLETHADLLKHPGLALEKVEKLVETNRVDLVNQ